LSFQPVLAPVLIGLVAAALLVTTGRAAPQADTWQRLSSFFTPPPSLRNDLGSLRPVLRFDDGRPVRDVQEWRDRRTEILAAWHRLLGPWPMLLARPAAQELWQEPVEGFVRHRLDVELAPGRKTGVYLLVPPGTGPFPAVIDVFYYPEDCAGLKANRRGQNDFGYQLVKRGFVALCVGQFPAAPQPGGDLFYPSWDAAQLQPLSYLAFVAANAHTLLAQRRDVDPTRIGIVGHSYGGKWALFAGALDDRFAAIAVSDPGIVFDEARPNVNYWEPWYLGYVPGREFRPRGVLSERFPRVGAYRQLVEAGRNLHELHALIAPRPFFVAGGSEDQAERWKALNHAVAVNALLGLTERVGMANRPTHAITPEASEQIALFFLHFLRRS
jgi:hypothetical protein